MLEKGKNDLIFGLDIGTRTIIGIVGYKQEKEFLVLASKVIEHESRAMVDGQIHDILAVARSAKKVKESLENQTGLVLNEVAIAAAGRVLKTVEVKALQTFQEEETINAFMIKGLEFQGIQEAKEKISQMALEDEENAYYYVGHSVVNYYLNSYAIANLEEQRGKEIGADILATFLPKVVVESLYTVMERVGLEVINLTLEPIAAMNAVIPANLRMLNLALVDIGAGTSDIAITKEGSVKAYGMIPLAGDAITEKLLHTYLVDFDGGENIKQQLGHEELIKFVDVIGISHEVLASDVELVIKEVIEKIGNEIADKIIALNGNTSPNAVFCVGGASQTSHIIEILANKLALPIERISIRNSEHAAGIIDEKKEIRGPESITPLGICLTTMEKRDNDFISMMVNGERVDLLHTKKMTILDAAVAIGLDHNHIVSVRGKTLMFKLNGERIRIKGGVGDQPKIMCNNKEASLETRVYEGDEIKIDPARNGEDGKIEMIDLIDQCGLEQENAKIRINGKIVHDSYQVKTGDEIEITNKVEAIQAEEKVSDQLEEKKMLVMVNQELVSMPYEKNRIVVTIFDHIDFDLSSPKGNIVLKLNGNRASYTDVLKNGDQIEIYWE